MAPTCVMKKEIDTQFDITSAMKDELITSAIKDELSSGAMKDELLTSAMKGELNEHFAKLKPHFELMKKFKVCIEALQEDGPTVQSCDGACVARPMKGRSWWKSYGFHSPCACAWDKELEMIKKEMEECNARINNIVNN